MRCFGFGNEDFCHDYRCRSAHNACRNQVSRINSHLDVSCENSACDCGETACHEAHEFASRHVFDVRFDDERRFGLPDEDVCRGRKAFRTACFKDFYKDPRKNADKKLQDSEVVENCEKRREKDDRRQYRKGERELVKQAAEDKLRAGCCKTRDFREAFVEKVENGLSRRGFENEKSEDELDEQAVNHDFEVNFFPVLAQQPCDEDENSDSEQTDKTVHFSSCFSQKAVRPHRLRLNRCAGRQELFSRFSR